jgi:hypothetical protein
MVSPRRTLRRKLKAPQVVPGVLGVGGLPAGDRLGPVGLPSQIHFSESPSASRILGTERPEAFSPSMCH